ncbi:MAG TPA: hypothetical protein VD814_08735 [Nocardioides sp.]|nr:hypothetical protein [Nocardioides sp.]
MNPSFPHDPDLHEPGTPGARGECSVHDAEGARQGACAGGAVVSFKDEQGDWQSGCSVALEQLVERGDIEPLGQGA